MTCLLYNWGRLHGVGPEFSHSGPAEPFRHGTGQEGWFYPDETVEQMYHVDSMASRLQDAAANANPGVGCLEDAESANEGLSWRSFARMSGESSICKGDLGYERC